MITNQTKMNGVRVEDVIIIHENVLRDVMSQVYAEAICNAGMVDDVAGMIRTGTFNKFYVNGDIPLKTIMEEIVVQEAVLDIIFEQAGVPKLTEEKSPMVVAILSNDNKLHLMFNGDDSIIALGQELKSELEAQEIQEAANTPIKRKLTHSDWSDTTCDNCGTTLTKQEIAVNHCNVCEKPL